MPGRKRSAVAHLFKDVESGGKVAKVKCNFCCVTVAKNGTRMTNHILCCKKCDDQIKRKYLSSKMLTNTLDLSKVNDDVIDIDEMDADEPETSDQEQVIQALSDTDTRASEVSARSAPQSGKKQPSAYSLFRSAQAIPLKKQPEAAVQVRSATTSKPKITGKALFSPQKNKINPYMDNMPKDQIVSTYTCIILY